MCTILFYGVFCVKLDAYLNQWNHWLNEMLDWVCLHDFYFIKHILPLIYLYRTNKSNRLTETKSIGLKLNTIQYLSIEKTLAHTRTMDKSKIGITTEYTRHDDVLQCLSIPNVIESKWKHRTEQLLMALFMSILEYALKYTLHSLCVSVCCAMHAQDFDYMVWH